MKKVLIFLFIAISYISVNAQSPVGGAGICLTAGDPNTGSLQVINSKYSCQIVKDSVSNLYYRYDNSLASGSKWVVMTLSEVDGSITNEGFIGVTAGSATTSILQGYNSVGTATGAGVTVTAGTGLSIAETTSIDGGVITLTNSLPDQVVSITGAGISVITGTYPNFTVTSTEVDGSVTNEIQTISATAAASNSTTVALNLAGGSFALSATAPLTLTGAANSPIIGFGTLIAYTDDIAAGTGGVAIGGWYQASAANTMGVKQGTPLIRVY
jgi:hypothetical protein